MGKSEKIKEKEGSVDLDINQSYLFAGMLGVLTVLFLLISPGLIFISVYLLAGYPISLWILPDEKKTTGRIFAFSFLWIIGLLPVLLFKNYYSFMHIEEEQEDST
ncbi:MAG: hypothetical protein ABEK04_04805 [Candidatus Nanohalobium sp.]